MTAVAAALALTLAAVLLVSGTLKLLPSGRLTVDDLVDLGVPAPLRRSWFTAAFPALELLLGLALLLAPAPLLTVAAAVAVLLMLAFTVVVLRVLLRGRRVDCACFGMLRSPLTPATAARNVLLFLAAAAVAVTADRGALPTLLALHRDDWTAFFATTTAVLAATALLVVAGRRAPAAPTTVPAPAAGAPWPARAGSAPWPAPDVEVLAHGSTLTPLAELARTEPLLLVLLSADCHACEQVAPQLSGWRERFGGAVEVAALSSDDAARLADAHPLLDAPVHRGARAVMTAAGIPGYPAALLLATDGTVAAGPAIGSTEVESLAAAVAEALAGAAPAGSR
ncbi:thioredoxin family protein [Herbiconiux sp. CPCC 205716]|uniref:Thioredoxin family protein n=1 Tax=Herbiconiux gentiana TaxID=2970912 RepID=A0ABT2GC23_9MICO|nr:thioredoxin family protein [Herbiconiux gentiana]MCS5713754.1 thioredoxin family protein [Herbiconiux gentiana]